MLPVICFLLCGSAAPSTFHPSSLSLLSHTTRRSSTPSTPFRGSGWLPFSLLRCQCHSAYYIALLSHHASHTIKHPIINQINRCYVSKRKTIQEGLVETVVKPQRKAQLPSLAVVSALEHVAAGDLAVAHGTDKVTPQQLMDQYICAIARFQVACSSRFNDLQHTSPANFKVSDKSLELQAWQTKTISAFRIKKNPVPLIAPLHSFTGKSWWKPLTTTWTRLVGHDNFKAWTTLSLR